MWVVRSVTRDRVERIEAESVADAVRALEAAQVGYAVSFTGEILSLSALRTRLPATLPLEKAVLARIA